MNVFVSATGTGVGKTWMTTALARHLAGAGRRVAALKPIETGCEPEPLDAIAIATACDRPELAHAAGFYRARLPLAPWAATAMGEPPPPAVADLVRAIHAASAGADDVIVEGAGGVLVPYDAENDLVDLALALGYPLLLVAPDVLGTLSHTRAAVEAAERRGARVAAIALTQPNPTPDLSATTNAELLARRLGRPIHRFPHAPLGPSSTDLAALLRDLT